LKNKRPKDYEEKKEELEIYKKQSEQGSIDLYYGDGSGFSLVPYIPYAWQEIGTTIEIPSFKSKTLNLFGIWDAKKDLNLYSFEGNLTSDIIIEYINDFSKKITKKTVLVLDNAPIHKSKIFKIKIKEWAEKGLKIFHLPSYSPHLNLIEHLWRFMKYEWIEFSVYNSWENLLKYIEKVANNFGSLYTINFV
jgi:transposase